MRALNRSNTGNQNASGSELSDHTISISFITDSQPQSYSFNELNINKIINVIFTLLQIHNEYFIFLFVHNIIYRYWSLLGDMRQE